MNAGSNCGTSTGRTGSGRKTNRSLRDAVESDLVPGLLHRAGLASVALPCIIPLLRPMPTFYQRFQESARKFPDNIALEIQRQQTVERVTFAELTRMSESVANWLSTRVPRDARVAILAANHPRWVAAYLGIIAAGRTAVPLDTAFHADQVKKLLIDSGASLLFCDLKHLPLAVEAVRGISVGLVMTSTSAERVATTGSTTNPTHRTERDEWGTQGLTQLGTEVLAGDLD